MPTQCAPARRSTRAMAAWIGMILVAAGAHSVAASIPTQDGGSEPGIRGNSGAGVALSHSDPPPITIVEDNDREDVLPRLTVRGKAELEVPADILRLNITVVSEGTDATDVLEENSERVDAVIDAIEKVGLTEDEYETGRFSVQPKYSRRPRELRGDTEWTPRIVGYEVANTISVNTKRLTAAGEIVQKANEAGANRIEGIRFELDDERLYRQAAIEEAATHARLDARTLAMATDVELVRVISIVLDDARARQDQMRFSGMRGSVATEGASAPAIVPGEVTVTASVTIVYEIRGRAGG